MGEGVVVQGEELKTLGFTDDVVIFSKTGED